MLGTYLCRSEGGLLDTNVDTSNTVRSVYYFICYDDNSTQIRQTCSFAACEATQQPNNAALKAPAHDAPAAGSAPATTRAHMLLLLLLHCCRLR
jgi:hypothetical protein